MRKEEVKTELGMKRWEIVDYYHAQYYWNSYDSIRSCENENYSDGRGVGIGGDSVDDG